MFVNKKLAVDIGGIHTPQDGTITISAANAASFGLTNGGVYEVEVFQAERQTTSSSFKLTLSGFNAGTSACGPVCGDRVVRRPSNATTAPPTTPAATTSARPTASWGRSAATPRYRRRAVRQRDERRRVRRDVRLRSRLQAARPLRRSDRADRVRRAVRRRHEQRRLRRLHEPVPARRVLRRRQGAEPAGAVRRRRQRRHLRELWRSDDAAAELLARPALR